MAWKRCAGCTRAIPTAAETCDYCGHKSADPLSAELTALDEPAALSSVDLAMDNVAAPLPVPPPVQSSVQSSVPLPPSIPPSRPAAGLKTPAIAMIATGLLAGAGLIFTLLTMRSSASPDTAAAPVNPKRVASAAPAPRVPAPSVATAAAPRWSHAADGRWLPAGRKSMALEVPAANKVHIWTRDVRPVLVVRCHAGGTDVFVFTDSAARMETQDQDHTVRLAFDDGRQRIERWPDSETHDALFARDGVAFAHELLAAHTLRFGFTPHNADPATARFDVSGLTELLAPAERQCGWKP